MPIIFSLVVVATATVSPLTAGAKPVTIPGDGLTYSFNESTGEFTVSGNGDMYDFRDSSLGNNKQTPKEYEFFDAYIINGFIGIVQLWYERKFRPRCKALQKDAYFL